MKVTETQIKILTAISVIGFDNSNLYPLYGSGQYRSANKLVKQGYGKIVSSSKHIYHTANMFFTLNDGLRFNYLTNQIESNS